jgi:hypothetical protein
VQRQPAAVGLPADEHVLTGQGDQHAIGEMPDKTASRSAGTDFVADAAAVLRDDRGRR